MSVKITEENQRSEHTEAIHSEPREGLTKTCLFLPVVGSEFVYQKKKESHGKFLIWKTI